MSMIEDQIFEREAAMQEHIERDEVNNRKIIVYLQPRLEADVLKHIEQALSSGSDQTFDLGDQKLSLGVDGLYHVLERGMDGRFHEVELPEETNETQRAA
ncbi:MAG: hypothetical protein HY975_00760 [Candidatus Kerfeldbacteria bacterium]|nr:hypothetical protein [Candidatus Kerfeldbacteria bacterium]